MDRQTDRSDCNALPPVLMQSVNFLGLDYGNGIDISTVQYIDPAGDR